MRIDSHENSTSFLYDKNGRQVAVKNDGDDVNCCNGGGYGKTFYNEYGQIFATQTPDNKLTIFGYDKLRRQDRIFSGAILELKSNEYKLEGLPVGEEFDIFVTKNNNEHVDDGIVKLELDNLTFVKHTTVKTTGSTLIGKLSTPSKQIIIVRKQPTQRAEFDFTGRTIASYDAQNNQTLYFYDSLGRQIAVIQPFAGDDNTRLAHKKFYDLASNVIANVVVPQYIFHSFACCLVFYITHVLSRFVWLVEGSRRHESVYNRLIFVCIGVISIIYLDHDTLVKFKQTI
ncbi:MAG: hypothetical protein LBC74_12040 [Planctomycetaceae bacterium]|nr:hypothetical protein [Planctomycetaceae bacterium]